MAARRFVSYRHGLRDGLTCCCVRGELYARVVCSGDAVRRRCSLWLWCMSVKAFVLAKCGGGFGGEACCQSRMEAFSERAAKTTPANCADYACGTPPQNPHRSFGLCMHASIHPSIHMHQPHHHIVRCMASPMHSAARRERR